MSRLPARTLAYTLVLVVALPLLDCGSLFGYMRWKIDWAHRTAQGLCDEVAVGAPVAGFESRARARGLEVMSLPARPGEDAELVAWQGFVFARWFCSVKHRGGAVVSKRVTFLD